MTKRRLPYIDVKAIIRVFGETYPAVVQTVRLAGFNIETAKIQKWVERNRITMDGWLLLSTAYEAVHGRALNLNDFIRQR